jgi:hypothetical protein
VARSVITLAEVAAHLDVLEVRCVHAVASKQPHQLRHIRIAPFAPVAVRAISDHGTQYRNAPAHQRLWTPRVLDG